MIGLVLAHLVFGFVLIGFGYLVIVAAGKETGKAKVAGQVIGWILILSVVLICASCGLDKANCPVCRKAAFANKHHAMMMNCGKMMDGEKKCCPKMNCEKMCCQKMNCEKSK